MFYHQNWLIFIALSLLGQSKHEEINDHLLQKQPVLAHSIKPHYYMDKGELIQLWVQIIHDPWQDNRLIVSEVFAKRPKNFTVTIEVFSSCLRGGIEITTFYDCQGDVSNSSVLSFNLTSHKHITDFAGVITRNVTATLFQHPDHASKLLENRANFSGEIEFHIKTFPVVNNSRTVSTKITLGCPSNRHLRIDGQTFKNCEQYKNFNYTISSAQHIKKENSKVVKYDVNTLGCPIPSSLTSKFKPKIFLYDGSEMVKEMTTNFIMWEKNGRNSYHYSHTMEQVGCLRASQSWNDMIIGNNTDEAWTQKNFESCYKKSNDTRSLNAPYEILNSTGGSSLVWDDKGIYAFKLRVVDPDTSFCDLTAEFAVVVEDTAAPNNVIPTFVILSSSCLGIVFGSIAAFYIDSYCF